VDAVLPRRWGRAYLPVAATGGLALAIVFAVLGWIDVGRDGPELQLSGMVAFDGFAAFVKVALAVFGLLTVWLGRDYLARDGIEESEFYGLVLFAVAGMMFMAAAADLIVIFLALETFSIALYVLVAFRRRSPVGQESALKYFLLGSFSSAFFLLGIALAYGAVGGTNLYGGEAAGGVDGIVDHIVNSSVGGSGLLVLATGLLIVGLGFKVAAVPFHMWTPDAYQGAPFPITAYLSATSKAAAFALLLRLFSNAFLPIIDDWQFMIAALAAITMVVGNLIALPLQYEARQRGNSVFIDDGLEPFGDQWAFLASVRRMTPTEVEDLAREAVRRGQVLGVRSTRTEDDAGAPWERPPSGRVRPAPITSPLPKIVRAVLAQRLFVASEGLPSPLLNGIKRLAAFQNPAFYEKQRMRLSTAATPRVISCAEELPGYVALPRGCLPNLESLLEAHGVELLVEDQRNEGEALTLRFRGQLTPVQQQAAAALLEHDDGVFVAPPGIGKTVLGTSLVAERGCSTLVLVHRRPLLDQWIAQLSMFLGIAEKDIGQIGGGKRKPNGQLDVAMIQSVVRKGDVDDLVASYGHVVVDECHHVPAVSFERVLSEVKARFVTGLTATPQRRDGHHPILEMQLGPIRFTVDPKHPAARRPFDQQLVIRNTVFRLDTPSETPVGIQDIYGALAADEVRNQLILDDVIRALEEGRSPILLTERRDHLEYFADRLRGFVRHLIVLHGGMKPKDRGEVEATLAHLDDHEERLVLATGRYIGEGFDDARLDTLFLALPMSWKGTLVQYTGRLHRLHPKKTDVRIFDYVDRDVPVLARMFEKRLRTYAAIGYVQAEGPESNARSQELTIEYDDEELSS
jgi:superfamily II DNA or RNA helicase